MSGESTEFTMETSPADAHLAEVAAGCGCAEVWERLSERREADGREASEGASDEVVSREGGD